ncbi:DUF962 domain-containing protein [Schlegelella aquatica]|uniref:Mpo1 family 2-hydroxy fatty acid dioxygenase n=1 Tax=Caldimonas aquatica TaxID=376175 RepID=UPI0037538B41
MRKALDLLTQYAEYHRDRRNIATHFVGVPLIVFAVGVLLARPQFQFGPWLLTPAWLVFAAAAVWYVTRHLVLGVAVSVAIAVLIALGQPLGQQSTFVWLASGIGAFVVGWVIQFIGHYYEGRKPAFVDDLVGLLVGPMFVVAEAMFALGWNREMLHEIEKRAGPTMLRDLANARS